ncbi:hypothetical protein EDD21DRAFT_373075 [Dissophora ornata]|nr:hypothetical protein EDD21DRAFT_373075 [Dissophora ornata]
MSTRQRTLYVSGFSQRSRPRDIAYEFERFGRLVRCDVPALRNNSSRPYAFVEYEDDRDARDAYNEMRDARFEGYRLNVQFAKNTPSASWRYERGGGGDRSRSPGRRARSPPRRRSPRRRTPSPAARRRSASPRGGSPSGRRPRSPNAAEDRGRSSASRSPVRDRSRDRHADRDGDDRDGDDRRHASRSRSPEGKNGGRGEAGDQSRSPSPRPRSISPRARSVTP